MNEYNGDEYHGKNNICEFTVSPFNTGKYFSFAKYHQNIFNLSWSLSWNNNG